MRSMIFILLFSITFHVQAGGVQAQQPSKNEAKKDSSSKASQPQYSVSQEPSMLDDITIRAQIENARAEELGAKAKAEEKKQQIKKFQDSGNYGMPRVKSILGSDRLTAVIIFDGGFFSEHSVGDVLPNEMTVVAIKPGDVRVKNSLGQVVRLPFAGVSSMPSGVR